MTPVEQYHRRVVSVLIWLAAIIGATALALSAIVYVFEVSDSATRSSVDGYHLRTLNLTQEISRELDRLNDELSTKESGSVQVNEVAALNSVLQTIATRVQTLRQVQEPFSDAERAPALARVEMRLDRLVSLPAGTESRTVRTMVDSFRLAMAQFEKLHTMRANELLEQVELNRTRQTTRLTITAVGFVTVSVILIAYAYRLLGASLRRHLETEIALEASERRLQESEKLRAVGQLIGGVAHDFNNLLMIINGYAESTLLVGELPAKARSSLQEILNAGTRAADLTRQLLTFSRQQPVERRFVDLNVLTQDVVSMFGPLIGDKVDLTFSHDVDILGVEADTGQLQQVLTNLIVNSRDAVSGGGTIAVSTAVVTADEVAESDLPPGSFCRLSVTDDGEGMNEETLARVFEPFFTTKAVGEGIGLGLSTVHGIVTSFDGVVSVASEINKGTRFDVYLPRCDEAPGIGEPASEQAAGGPETVLLIEDERNILELAADKLTKLGYRVLIANSGRQAVEVSNSNPAGIDLIVSDVIMPGMNGPEAVGQILATQPRAQVIYMSGYTDDVVLKTGAVPDGALLLRKPLKLDDLARLIRTSLDMSQSEVA